MRFQAFACIALILVTSVWADEPAEFDRSKATRASVGALANVESVPLVRESPVPEAKPAKPQRRPRAEEVRKVDRVPDERPAAVRKDRERQANRRQEANGARVGNVARPGNVDMQNRMRWQNQNQLWQQQALAAQPWFNPWFSPWGNAYYSNRIMGYRSYRYPYGFGYGGFGYSNFVPGFGYSFTPVAFGLSGPETIRYEDPLRRQWKLVDDGIRDFASGRP